MTEQLTAEQADIIERLRAAGYHSIADCATGCWQINAPCLFSITLRDAMPPGITADLAADFERANEQVRAASTNGRP